MARTLLIINDIQWLGYGSDKWRIAVRFVEEATGFSPLQSVRKGSGDHPVFNQQVSRASSWRWSGLGVRLTTHLHPVPRLRTTGTTPSLPHTLSWRAQGQLYIYFDTGNGRSQIHPTSKRVLDVNHTVRMMKYRMAGRARSTNRYST